MLLCAALATLPAITAAQDYATDLEVSKTASPAVPSDPLQPIEFTVTVTNLGSGPATRVVVQDQLPEGLVIPDGTAAATSSGVYDAAGGEWQIGHLAPQATAVMTLPAIVASAPQPDCLVNEAMLRGEDDNPSNDTALAAVRSPGTERCVSFDISTSRPIGSTTPCGGSGVIDYEIYIWNRGPDAARDVQLAVTETSAFRLPGFSLRSQGCDGLTCTRGTLDAGGLWIVRAASDSFKNKTARTHEMTLRITSADAIWGDGHVEMTSRDLGPFNVSCPDFGLPDDAGRIGLACFIATAAYGTALDPRIDALRKFRDDWLLRAPGGEYFVRAYYRWSPPVADYIAGRPTLRAVVRGLLVPVLVFARYPVACLLALAFAIAGVAAHRRIAGGAA